MYRPAGATLLLPRSPPLPRRSISEECLHRPVECCDITIGKRRGRREGGRELLCCGDVMDAVALAMVVAAVVAVVMIVVVVAPPPPTPSSFFLFFTNLLSSSTRERFYPQPASGQAVVSSVFPSLPLIAFILYRAYDSAFLHFSFMLVDFHRSLLTYAFPLVNFHERKSPYEHEYALGETWDPRP